MPIDTKTPLRFQNLGIDKVKISLYYAVMKKIFVYFFVIVTTLSLIGCSHSNDNSIYDTPDNNFEQNTPENDFTGSDENSNLPPNKDPIQNSTPPSEPEKIVLSYLVSNTDNLRIRAKANNNSEILGYLDKNDALALLGETEKYYKTIYKEKDAYVHKSYCKIMEMEKSGEKEEKAIELGSKLLGYPYVWGSQRYHWGNGKLNTAFVNGEFDCSALVQYVYYKSNGVILDLTTRTQINNGIPVTRENLKRGDLMFFTNSSRKNLTGNERIGHVGIYFGNNYILHTASDHAVIEPISTTRWSYYITARRVV